VPTEKLTKRLVDSLRLPESVHKPVFYRDEALKGFGLKATSNGTKTFIVEKRINGKVKRITLGRYGALTVEQARKEAQKILGEIAQGVDPIAERQAHQVKGVTLEMAFKSYFRSRKDLKDSTVNDYKKALSSYLPDWANTPIASITKDMVEVRHREIGKRSHSRANGTMRVLRAVFNNAMHEYEDSQGNPVITSNPVNRLSQKRAWFPDKRKTTLIKAHELKPWYDATMQLNQEVTRDYLHFLLFTGLRRSEASGLTWDTVDFKDKTFTIPDTKNKEPHTLPMSDVLEEILQRRFSSTNSQWVFPSPVQQDKQLTEPRTAIDRVTELSGVPFTCHDLRRTFITIAESIDIPAYALKRLMNHKDPNDVTAGYIIKSVDRLRKPMQDISNFIQTRFREET